MSVVFKEQQGPCNSTSGHLYGEKLDLKRNMHPIFHSSTVSIAKMWKQTKCLILFFRVPKSLQIVTAAMKLKDVYSLEGKL